MIKKILFIFMFVIMSSFASAKGGINIFAYSRQAPTSVIYSSRGIPVHLSDFGGNFVLVMFWSRHCAPCIKELDEINTFVNKTANNGVKVLLVSNSDEWSGVGEQRQLLQKFGATDVDFYTDKDGKLAGDFGIFSYPHTVLINRSGEEIGRISGTADWDDDDIVEYIYKLKAQHG
ncbi:MAG: TlpA family protein disulfide reductase [Alphaproteobacteria bacterium]|nr:TlpA family protein disulfide reductase [Alphaproteobacteria bacterium]